jgi:hypothetical protein
MACIKLYVVVLAVEGQHIFPTFLLLLCVQVLDVSRCGILDAGGAAICSALLQQDTLRELHLSWNALSHGTAQALETVLR